MRPEADSGTPLTVFEPVPTDTVQLLPRVPSHLHTHVPYFRFHSFNVGIEASRFAFICSHPRVTVPLLLKRINWGEVPVNEVTSATAAWSGYRQSKQLKRRLKPPCDADRQEPEFPAFDSVAFWAGFGSRGVFWSNCSVLSSRFLCLVVERLNSNSEQQPQLRHKPEY